jgi:predicted transcriptional regulator
LEHAIERLPALIGRVHEALLKIVIETPDELVLADVEQTPAPSASRAPAAKTAPPQKTVFPDHLICLEDGQSFKTLKRHLAVHHGLTPESYRKKWSLPDDYPMAAPDYAASRAAIARKIGLGASGRGGKPAIMLGKKARRRP